MPTLYELTGEYNALMDAVGEDASAFETAIDQLTGAIEDKAAGCCAVIRQLEAEAKMFGTEAKRLADHASSKRAAAARLTAYLKTNMEAAGLKEVKAGLFNAKLQKGSWACAVTDEAAIPAEYKETVKPDPYTVVKTKDIIAAWSRKEAGPGTAMTQSEFVVIR